MPKPKFAPLEVPGLPGVAAELEFDGLKYAYQRTVETNLDGNYVPDWTAGKAVKESVQNQLDESLGSETKPYFGILNAETVWLRDAGRGVRLNTILRIGKSGKRDDARMVGQHGEGEVVSTLVAARQGLVKLLASQDWLAPRRLIGTRYMRGTGRAKFTVALVPANQVRWLDGPGDGLLVPAGTPIYHLDQDEYAFDAPYAVE
jgi:hypothetical protein